jgi:hypothetical protein
MLQMVSSESAVKGRRAAAVGCCRKTTAGRPRLHGRRAYAADLTSAELADAGTDERKSTDLDTHSEDSRVEPGRLFDQLATAEDSQAAKATDAPRIRTIATYRA